MYRLTSSEKTIIRVRDNASIPSDELNTDYQEYLRWLDEGNTPQPADPVPVPAVVVSPFQAKAALLQAGLLDDVVAAIAAGDPLLKLAWDTASEFRSDSPAIVAIASAMGWGESDLLGLFEAAKTISV